jgi:hypothetical protein
MEIRGKSTRYENNQKKWKLNEKTADFTESKPGMKSGDFLDIEKGIKPNEDQISVTSTARMSDTERVPNSSQSYQTNGKLVDEKKEIDEHSEPQITREDT